MPAALELRMIQNGRPSFFTSPVRCPVVIRASAMTGAAIAGMTTFSVTPLQLTPAVPSAASPAPIRPPNSACEELDGIPTSQVSRFHRMPPTSPARQTGRCVDARQ